MSNLITNFETLLAQGKDNAMLRFSLGNAYFGQHDFAMACHHLAKAVKLDPNYSAAWKLYGKALVENGEPAAAIAVYEAGIAVAEKKGDLQAAKEMKVFLRRLQ